MDMVITEKIKELHNLLCKSIEVWEKKANINSTQYQIVVYLMNHKDEEVCQKDLEQETHLKKASITGTLDSLEEKDIIIRKPSDSDKRRNIITLSERVENNISLAREKALELENTLQNILTDEEKESFVKMIDKMIKKIKTVSSK